MPIKDREYRENAGGIYLISMPNYIKKRALGVPVLGWRFPGLLLKLTARKSAAARVKIEAVYFSSEIIIYKSIGGYQKDIFPPVIN